MNKFHKTFLYVVIGFTTLTVVSCGGKNKVVEIPFADGYYIGNVNENNEPDGIGAYCYPDGVMCGEFRNGKRNGKAVIIDGRLLFKGEFLDDRANGWGVMQQAEDNLITTKSVNSKGGGFYIGDYINGKKNGIGISTLPFNFGDGNKGEFMIYKGDFKDDLSNGVGAFIAPKIAKYEGDFSNGKMDGRGVFHSLGDDSKYDGYWKNGERNGYGVIVYSSAAFEGIWLGGAMDVGYGYKYTEEYGGMKTNSGFHITGEGIPGQLSSDSFTYDESVRKYIRHREKEQIQINDIPQRIVDAASCDPHSIRCYYYGYLDDRGNPDGYGSLDCSNLTASVDDEPLEFYQGYWKSGVMNGYGEMHYVNGDFYEGLWKDNKKEGPGKMTFANGDVFDGMWKNDLMHGDSCTFISHDGEIKTGRWANGEYVGSYEEINKIYDKYEALAKERRARYLEIINKK